MDIEVHCVDATVVLAKQIKTRGPERTWGRGELLQIVKRWIKLPLAKGASFEIVTAGRLGPSAEALRDALSEAAEGEWAQIAKLVGISASDPIYPVLARVAIRQELYGVEPILAEAERQVRSMLPGSRCDTDLSDLAGQTIDRLFRVLSTKASYSAPEERFVGRDEIADILGGLDRIHVEDRWPGTLQNEYLHLARDLPDGSVTAPRLLPTRAQHATLPWNDQTLGLEQLRSCQGPVILTGRPGSGKSTAAAVLQKSAAVEGSVVLVAHAEAYLGNRLDALVADALSAILRRDIPSATGKQLLHDANVVLFIDGVSEVPHTIRNDLREELRGHVARGNGARIILAGRDIAAVTSVLPVNALPTRFTIAPIGHSERFQLAQRLVPQGQSDGDRDTSARTLIGMVERSLGDAAENPMLFVMGAQLINDGIPFEDRPSMYAAAIERMAERGLTSDMASTVAVLGVVFSRLLDEGRRYAAPLEWSRLVSEACTLVADAGIDVSPLTVREAADRCGLLTTIGYTQLRAPLHDSFADYLAGWASAKMLTSIPDLIADDDYQRVIFAAEIGGVDTQLATAVTRSLPFCAARIAQYDRRPVDHSSPGQATEHLKMLLPEERVFGINMWNDGIRTIAYLTDGPSGWVEHHVGQQMLHEAPSVVCTSDEGPLAVAVRLWRVLLKEALRQSPGPALPRLDSIESACAALQNYAVAESEALSTLIDQVAPARTRDPLMKAIGPFGLEAIVRPRPNEGFLDEWPIEFAQASHISVRANEGSLSAELEAYRESSVESVMRKSPQESASDRINDAINTLVGNKWL
ncbi:hypothetical protein Snas_0381 [Stackebrandtia nassauensis DSM 44728]|uniref:Uncharacterized protein n=2 Tax=Stackebrandtia TaxID=283810 RepID=D3Q4D8_STANL|nr:hypothetical protein Snas_0381 [Stackebrandtia nassauensis DSM 44728]